ncbi:MAG: tetratricopeptide repeat protein, partial [Proteobacteria bacterium]|nr:tetratricopeptide repeat protein [Pseudomonadota bacterium]
PSHSGALINLGVLAKRSGDLDSALRYLEEALQETPDSVEALSNLGHVYYHRDNLQKARQVFERLTQIDSTLVDIHLILSMVYVRLESPELVVTECDRLMSLLGLNRNLTLNSLLDLSNLFIDIGKVLLEQKRAPLASLAFNVAMHLGGEAIQTIKRIGRICFQHGDYNASLEYLEKAIRLNPQDWENFCLMGDCYTKMGAEEAAVICHQKAKELNPY